MHKLFIMDNYSGMIVNMKQRYKDNPYVLQRLHQYMQHLSDHLKNMEEEYNKRNARKDEQIKLINMFVKKFFQKYELFYISNTELFIQYKDNHYSLITEDDIYHLIHNELKNQPFYYRVLKFKIKNSILKQIKENTLFQTIPETNTIQMVLHYFSPSVFVNKNHLKYFFTIIGDTLFKKNTHLIHIIDHSYKMFLTKFSQYIYQFFGKSITETFKYKYYEHHYENCRLFEPIQYKSGQSMDHTFLREHIFDIMVVCCYYSVRYKSSDLYIKNESNDTVFNKHTLLLSTFTPSSVVDKFVDELFMKEDEQTLSYKDMYFLWRVFLKKYKLPCISSQTNFKSILQEKGYLEYETEICTGIKSTVPITWNTFQQFWSQNIQMGEDIDDELEIDEITTLYNDWANTKGHVNEEMLNEEYLMEIMSWMMPEVLIDENKYIYNISCKLWDKKKDIHQCLEVMQKDVENKNTENKYKYYVEWVKENKRIVSKRYFDSIISAHEESV